MWLLKPTAGAIVSACIWTSPASAAVTIVFKDPESYSDQALRNGYGRVSRDAALAELRRHLVMLGSRYLPQNQILEIEVLDIQLAGRFEPWNILLRDVRIMRASTWPMIKLRYRLREGDETLAVAEETVRDMEYLTRVRARMSTEPLRFEKAMLDDWFRERFAAEGR